MDVLQPKVAVRTSNSISLHNLTLFTSNKQVLMCLWPAIKLFSGFSPCYFLIAEIPLFWDIRKGFSVDLILAYILALSRTFQKVFRLSLTYCISRRALKYLVRDFRLLVSGSVMSKRRSCHIHMALYPRQNSSFTFLHADCKKQP